MLCDQRQAVVCHLHPDLMGVKVSNYKKRKVSLELKIKIGGLERKISLKPVCHDDIRPQINVFRSTVVRSRPSEASQGGSHVLQVL